MGNYEAELWAITTERGEESGIRLHSMTTLPVQELMI